MIKRVGRFMENCHMVPEFKKILVGFSGGADSVCLMEVLRELADDYGLSLYAVHVHHGIRGEAAEKDAQFARQYCETYAIPFRLYHVSAPEEANNKKISLEEAGRILRYRAFAEMQAYWQTDAVAVAHHQNDQAETVLFQIARGSNLTGAGGIRPVQHGIIRPLLCVSKKEILSFLEERGLSWREDETNQDTVYTRNCIRKEILPLLEERVNEKAVEHLAALALQLQETENYLRTVEETLWQQLVKAIPEGLQISDKLLDAPKLFHGRVILRTIEAQSGGRKDITADHVEKVKRLFTGSCGKKTDLPGDIMAWKEQNGVCVGKQKTENGSEQQELVLQIPGHICIEKKQIDLCIKPLDLAKIPQNKYTKWFDYDKIKNSLTLRKRRPQDVIGIDDAGHHKSLKRFMIDRKIPQHIRDSLWVIADGDSVLWLVGERIGADYKVTENTAHVLEIRITGECEDER